MNSGEWREWPSVRGKRGQGLTRGCIYREGVDHVHHHRLEGEYHAAADEREALEAQRRQVSKL